MTRIFDWYTPSESKNTGNFRLDMNKRPLMRPDISLLVVEDCQQWLRFMFLTSCTKCVAILSRLRVSIDTRIKLHLQPPKDERGYSSEYILETSRSALEDVTKINSVTALTKRLLIFI